MLTSSTALGWWGLAFETLSLLLCLVSTHLLQHTSLSRLAPPGGLLAILSQMSLKTCRDSTLLLLLHRLSTVCLCFGVISSTGRLHRRMKGVFLNIKHSTAPTPPHHSPPRPAPPQTAVTPNSNALAKMQRFPFIFNGTPCDNQLRWSSARSAMTLAADLSGA